MALKDNWGKETANLILGNNQENMKYNRQDQLWKK